MIPKPNSDLWKKSKFALLEIEDIVEKTDEYYNPIKDKWLPVEKEFIGYEFEGSDISKPIRRKGGLRA